MLEQALCAYNRTGTAIVFSTKVGVVPENIFQPLLNDRLVAKGTILDFITDFFKASSSCAASNNSRSSRLVLQACSLLRTVWKCACAAQPQGSLWLQPNLGYISLLTSCITHKHSMWALCIAAVGCWTCLLQRCHTCACAGSSMLTSSRRRFPRLSSVHLS